MHEVRRRDRVEKCDRRDAHRQKHLAWARVRTNYQCNAEKGERYARRDYRTDRLKTSDWQVKIKRGAKIN